MFPLRIAQDAQAIVSQQFKCLALELGLMCSFNTNIHSLELQANNSVRNFTIGIHIHRLGHREPCIARLEL